MRVMNEWSWFIHSHPWGFNRFPLPHAHSTGVTSSMWGQTCEMTLSVHDGAWQSGLDMWFAVLSSHWAANILSVVNVWNLMPHLTLTLICHQWFLVFLSFFFNAKLFLKVWQDSSSRYSPHWAGWHSCAIHTFIGSSFCQRFYNKKRIKGWWPDIKLSDFYARSSPQM